MNLQNKKIIWISVIALVVFGVLMRWLPHMPNFTPITALAFVGSWYLGKRWGLVLPLAAMFCSDLLIGFYSWPILITVYGSFLIIGFFGWAAVKSRSVLVGGLSVIGSSVFFFLTTNAAVWLFSPWYAKNVAGLLFSYELGLPFFRNMLMGDLVYIAILVCAFELAFALSRKASRQVIFT